MWKNILKAFCSLLVLASVISTMAGCSFFDLLKPESYTVTLVRGGDVADESVTVSGGKKLSRPEDPVREGYAFLGWYVGEVPYDFDKKVTGDKTITAKWQKLHTVTFDTYGFGEIPSEVVPDGEKLTEPERPTREGYRFGGWFSGGEKYDFTDPVSGDLKLTVYWIQRPKNLIYDCETELTLILPDNYLDIGTPISSLFMEVSKGIGYIIDQSTAENAEESAHEIVIGRTSRPISEEAYVALEALERERGEAAFLIYSNGSSVAIAYDESYENIAVNSALRYFEDNYATAELALAKGVAYSETIDVYSRLFALDEQKRATQWHALELYVGKDVADAIRDFYSIYEPTMIDWYANLYDSSAGGYYYSNSARDNLYVTHRGKQYQLLPDIESTNQALNFISASGLAAGQGYMNVIPSWMKEEIVAFVKGMQDSEDGYFYHPQWGKALTSTQLSRMGRDLSWATNILSALGYSPIYDTPNGYSGSGIISSKLSSPLSSGKAIAVSRVVAAASVPRILASEEAFRNYLAGFNLNEDSYPVGNELASQANQFVARDRQLEREGADYRICDILIEWLNEHQYPETGHWNAVADYEGTNGLLKISSVYNAVGAPFPNAEAAMRSAIGTITTDVPAGTVCYPYNCWFSISNIMTNLRKHGDDNGIANKIRAELLENAPEAIRATKEKVLTFKKSDGSFSYTTTKSAATSQGMPVAIPNTNEGDVNATGICSTGTLGNMFSALGLSSYKVDLFGSADWYRYVTILEENRAKGGFPKDEEIPTYSGKVDFNAEEIGTLPAILAADIVTSGGTASVQSESTGDNAVYFKTVAGGNDSLTVYVIDENTSYTKVTFEATLRLKTSSGGVNYQLMFDDTSGNHAYMINMRYALGYVGFYDCSSTGDGDTRNENTVTSTAATLNEEFVLKVEHIRSASGDVTMKVYIDGNLMLTSNNYYNSHKSDTPSVKIDKMRFYSQSGTVAELYIDDISFKQE